MPIAPDPYDKIVAAIAKGFEQAEAKQRATGIHFDPKGAQDFKSMLVDAVKEGSSQAARTGGRGGIPRIHNPYLPPQSDLPGLPQPHQVEAPAWKTGQGITGMVQNAATALSHRVAQRTQNVVMDHAANMMQAQLDRYGQGEQVGNFDSATGRWNVITASGQTYQQAPDQATLQAMGKATAMHRRGSLAAGALAGIGSGQGMFAGMSEAAMMVGMPELAVALPMIDAATKAAKEAIQLPQQIRAKGAEYQGIYGGSTAAGLGQQALGAGFGLSQVFDLGFGQAGQAFEGVSQMGVQGGERQNMLNFVVREYNKLGMSVKESLAAVQQAAQQGNEELIGLASSINQVTNAARANGVNAGQSRQVFSSQLGSLFSSGVAQNSTSQAIAAGMTAYQAGGGQMFQGVNLTGLSSQQAMMAMAGVRGVGVETIQGLAMAPGGAVEFGKLQGQAFNQIAAPFIQMAMPTVMRFVQMWKSLPADHQPQISGNSPEVQNIVSQIAQSDSTQSWLQGCVNAVAQFTGQQQSPMIAGAMVVMQAIQIASQQVGFKNGQGIGLGAQMQAAPVSSPLNKSDMKALVNRVGGISSLGPDRPDFAFGAGGNKTLQSIYKSAGISAKGGELSNAQALYLRSVLQSGAQNATLAKLAGDNTGLNKQKFIVQTAAGPREVDYNTLATHYGDQAAAGQVTIASGKLAGEEVNTALGIQPTQGVDVTSNTATPFKGAAKFKSGSAGGFTGTITVAPTQALQSLLSFSSPDLNLSSARASNLPVNPYGSPSSNPATQGSS